MTAPSPADRPSRSLLNADSRRSLALLAGDDLEATDADAAQKLADECPDCRGHLASVRGGLDALRNHEPAEHPGGLWSEVRDGLDAAFPATEPSSGRRWMPAFAVTAAALLVGLFAFAPNAGQVLPDWSQPGETVRPAGNPGPVNPVRPRTQRFPERPDRGTLSRSPVYYPR
ncbi:MAG: hypothetical protein AAF907_02940 [Planctomycetota bacterium]